MAKLTIGTLSAILIALVQVTHVEASRSSSIVLTPDESVVCIANQDNGSVSLWNWASDGEVRTVPVGEEPRTLAVSPDGLWAYVATQRSETLDIVNLQTSRLASSLPLSGQPVGVVLSEGGERAFVSQFAGDYIAGVYVPGVITVVDLEFRRVLTKIAVKGFPSALAIDHSNGTLYVSHYFPRGGQGTLSVIDTEQLKLRQEIVLPEDKDDQGGGGVLTAVSGIALHPTAKRALVVGMHANARRGMTQNGRALSHKTTVQAAVRVVDLDVNREMETARIVSSFSGQAVAVPAAVAFLPSGKHFLDVYFASHDLKLIEYNERGLVAERALLELPDGPTGVAITRDGKTAFFNCRWARCVAQVSLENIRQPRLIRQVKTAAEIWSAGRILGAKIFHNTRDTRMTPNRWLSCAACHLDGGILSDNLVWEFTLEQKPTSPRLINTKPLSLTAWSSPPILIRGEYQTVHEEEKFIRSFLGGSGFLPGAANALPIELVGRSRELDALNEYVLSLRPRPNPHKRGALPRPEILAAARRGRALFHRKDVGCAECHRGSHLTRSGSSASPALADVGTGILADVPSLRGLWASAPYLHDGRASHLREVMTKYNPQNQHGQTSHLNAQELQGLIAFLLAPFTESPQ